MIRITEDRFDIEIVKKHLAPSSPEFPEQGQKAL